MFGTEDVFAEALFVSDLQRSDAPTAEAVHAAITQTLGRYGSDGCAGRVATEFGDHPETAVVRMNWARGALTNSTYAALVAAA